jgi:hypothetical protein
MMVPFLMMWWVVRVMQGGVIEDFVWEDMNNYEGQSENFTGSVGPQGAAKKVAEIVGSFQIIFQQGICIKNC